MFWVSWRERASTEWHLLCACCYSVMSVVLHWQPVTCYGQPPSGQNGYKRQLMRVVGNAFLFSWALLTPMQKVQNTAACLVLRAPRHRNLAPLLQQLHWLPISSKTSCMCYKSITGSTHSSFWTTAPLVLPALCQTNACWDSNCRIHGSHTLWPPHLAIHTPVPTFGTIPRRLCCTLFLQKQTQDISLLQIFQLSNTAHHPHQSVCASCTQLRVNPCWCVHCVSCFVKLLITFSILIYLACVILCLFSAG